MSRGLRVLWALLAALALIAAACGSDDDGDVSAETTEEATEEATPEPTEEATEEATPEATEEATEEATPEATEEATEEPTPEALPASFRGVTEDTIKVGVASPDWKALQQAGVPNYQGDSETAFQPFFDIINAEGGIYGRQIEPVYVPFEWSAPVTQEEACVKFAEDEEVFIVLYGLLGTSNLCLTDLYDTMVMTRSFQTTDLVEASGDTVWLSLNAADDKRSSIMAGVLAESGRLDGKTIAILSSVTTGSGSEGEAVQATLSELGFESDVVVVADSGGDAVARENEVKIIAQRLLTDGVDYVIDLIGGINTQELMAQEGYTPEFATKSLQASVDATTDKSTMDGVVAVTNINEQAIWEDEEYWENCMNVVLEAHPELESEFQYFPSGEQQAAGERDWLNPIIYSCNQTALLKELGEIAGADLTNDSFRAALDELGPFRLHGYGQASYNSESKWDGLDEFYIQVYRSETDTIEILGDAIIIERS